MGHWSRCQPRPQHQPRRLHLYRRGELASLTLQSFNLDSDPPTVACEAAYSKRRRHDVVPLHPAVVERLRAWLAARSSLKPNEPLFALRTESGGLRRTSKMMMSDLERAIQAWIQEAEGDEKERQRREESDFLRYQDEKGLYADFHANRHTFISNLARAGVSPKAAQTVARRSDVNLTMGVYSHVDVIDQAAAINALPAPPITASAWSATAEPAAAMDERQPAADESVVHIVVQTFGLEGLPLASSCPTEAQKQNEAGARKPLPQEASVTLCQALATPDASSGGGTRTPDTRIMIPLL